jgi:hypothetical protein
MANIDIEKLSELTAKADKIFISPEGEQELIKLLEIQQQVEDAIAKAKTKLEEAARKMSPNFTSIQANNIKVYYRAYGAKYYMDQANAALAPKELYTVETKTIYKLDSDAIEKWADDNKGMPAGIVEVARKKTLSFSLKKGGQTDGN